MPKYYLGAKVSLRSDPNHHSLFIRHSLVITTFSLFWTQVLVGTSGHFFWLSLYEKIRYNHNNWENKTGLVYSLLNLQGGMEMVEHPFDLATELSYESGTFRGQTSEAYANMVGPYGGITAATMLRAVMEHPDRIGQPLSLTVNFTAPIKDGEFFIKAKPARTNRSTQHWVLELFQGQDTLCTGTAVTALRRETWSDIEASFPRVPEPEKIASLPTENLPLPRWVSRYDIKVIKGFPDPLAKEPKENIDSVTLQWVKDKPDRPLDFLSLTSICDAFFPRVYIRKNEISPASTVSLTIYYHAEEKELDAVGHEPLLGEAKGIRYYNGFFDHFAKIWSREGNLLATTTQVVYYKD